jgi:hypothetical protein
MKTQEEKMIQTIQNLSKALPLSDYYTWNIPAGCSVAIPPHIKSPFDRNIYLKQNLHTHLGRAHDWQSYFWIIQDWGGIKSFKNTPVNQARIEKFFSQLDRNKLSKDSHSLLPSLSKLAAFKHPLEYSIYDSRAVFALNWLLFCNESSPVLFPQPPSRNKTLTEIDTQTLFRLSGRAYEVRSYKTAYIEYCDLLKELSRKALKKQEPYYLEMLLFVAAEVWVSQDIRKRTTVTIKGVLP